MLLHPGKKLVVVAQLVDSLDILLSVKQRQVLTLLLWLHSVDLTSNPSGLEVVLFLSAH